ncbi:hypothetical protein F511_31996 [Dorcoceras hygrometricum]|uniref:Uncharacterized protein n=1 Tax=Dorcoceras hygrometricum TaxID=472368 RepID=A0A2Z7CV91_9LAMI|nr:hypothetical protein F511_31996 [Dorcoceras hygrometricum]
MRRLGRSLVAASRELTLAPMPMADAARLVETMRAKSLRDASAGSTLPCAALGDRWWPPRASSPLRRSTRLLCAMVDACWHCRATMAGRSTLLDCVQNVARGSRWCADQRRTIGRDCAALVAAARPYFVRKFEVAAAGRPPLLRVSGDVVTAGLISSRVWFGPVPGSP